MKRNYSHFKSTSGLAAENTSYLEQLEHHDSVDNGESVHFKFTQDIVDEFNRESISHSINSDVSDNQWAQILYQIGYRFADTNPLNSKLSQDEVKELINQYGYKPQGSFDTSAYNQFCGRKAIDAAYIVDQDAQTWLKQHFVKSKQFSNDEKINILKDLIAADGFEKYLDLKFVGQKRFSLEGNDSLIPVLNRIVNQLPSYDYGSLSMGMAHRGRLNVLLNVYGMMSATLIDMFSGNLKSISKTSGDVKYHFGVESEKDVEGNNVRLSLANNPSHLEFITPVVMGEVKAKQKLDKSIKHLGVSIHGDAAVSGQGIVMESMSMSKIPAHTVGGMIHIVLDNQIGFTNDQIESMRSSYGCADIAKMIELPILYANADDPEACCEIADIAIEYVHKYQKSIFLVLIGYRRHGHNEGDEPSMTSPLMYKKINKHSVPAKLYADQLIAEDVLDLKTYDGFKQSYKKILDDGGTTIEGITLLEKKQVKLYDEDWRSDYSKNCKKEDLLTYAKHIATLPNGFTCHKSIMRLVQQRLDMSQEKKPLDWGMAELLAYATLLANGSSVRLNGQDAERGTFSHRHAVLHSIEKEESYKVLSSVCGSGAVFDVHNSFLSEQGVLGFEYGYSLIAKNELVLWEAQFGDFANGAQVIIDQFISSGMQKWSETSKLVLLLPHGYEGMGPEHTSARLERFLQLSAQNNIQVCVPTTPAQIYNLLLRQHDRDYTRPLVVLTPKSLLRHPKAVSKIDELVNQKFLPLINDSNNTKADRVILCSGKVYYDLLQYRDEHKESVAIIRLEQLYPFPDHELKEMLSHYTSAKKFIWCQEEPINQGAWFVLRSRMNACLPDKKQLTYVGRDAAAAPAVGYHNRHVEEQVKLVDDAFKL